MKSATAITRRSSRRNWEDLSENIRKRYARYGITPSYYESGGSLQHARGHLPREHVTRFERNPNALTSSDYRFLKKQQRRAKLKVFFRQIAAFKEMTREQRDRLKQKVAADHRAYLRVKSKSGIVRGEGTEGLKDNFRSVFIKSKPRPVIDNREVSDIDDYDDDDFISEFDDFISEFDDFDYEFDEDLKALMFYH